MPHNMRLFSFLAAVTLCGSLVGAEQRLSYVELVKRLTDLEYLATLPIPGEQCAQWSSYDRKSRYDETSGKYVGWEANGDGGGIIRKEGDQFVVAEMAGPGCLWRIWSADPREGHVRIYLDGASEPAIDLPFKGYFDGQNAPFTRSAIVHTVARGWNNYTPIPYRKSCKVVADPGWGRYYHFTYSTFPKGTEVPTFKRQLAADEEAALDEANRILSHSGPQAQSPQATTVTGESQFGEQGNATITVKGPAAITSIRVRTELPPSPEDYNALRSVWIQIRWDGEEQPSVWAPLGDFFGTAPGPNPYRSLPLGLSDDGWWYCNWYMPFAKSGEVLFKKDGSLLVKLKYQIVSKPLSGNASRLARFHAKWHRDAFPPAEPERRIDWPVLKTEGAGRFVGMMLHIWNPRGGWWGEGDEKFFVDGEKFPSTFGTGSEDYFGYAWCDPGLFQNAFHNQTHNDGNNRGHISVNRWHIADSVPFQKSFEGCIEKYYSNQRPTLYAAMAYWYLAPGGKDPYPPVPLAERIGYWNPLQTFKAQGAMEGERLKVLAKTGGEVQTQGMTSYADQWSDGAQLWWTGAKPADKLDLALPVNKAGNYNVTVQLTKARDYAIVQLYLDGQKLGDRLDLFNPSVVPTGALTFGVHELTAGPHKLTIEIVSANPKALKRYMAGLDYVKLELQPQ